MPSLFDFINDLLGSHLVFLRYALLLSIISATVCAVLGSFVILRGISFIGDAIAHAVFPGIAVAFVTQGSLLLGGAVSGVATALIIALLSVKQRVKADALIGILFVTVFACGLIVIAMNPGYAGSLQQILLGSVGAVSAAHLQLSAVIAFLVLAAVWVLHRGFVLVALDRELALAAGLQVLFLEIMLYGLVAVAVVIAVQSIGAILVLALLLTPAATARLLTEKLSAMVLVAVCVGIFAAVIGIYLAWGYNLPPGSAIVLVATGIFLLSWIFSPKYGVFVKLLDR